MKLSDILCDHCQTVIGSRFCHARSESDLANPKAVATRHNGISLSLNGGEALDFCNERCLNSYTEKH